MRAPDRHDSRAGKMSFVLETLVISLQMIMSDESTNTRAEMTLSQRNHPTEAFQLLPTLSDFLYQKTVLLGER